MFSHSVAYRYLQILTNAFLDIQDRNKTMHCCRYYCYNKDDDDDDGYD